MANFRFLFFADCQLGAYATFSGMTEEEVAEYAERKGEPASWYLMPLSFAAILGGLVTVIGTSTTVVVSGLLESVGEAPLGKVANVEKKMPRSYITRDGFGITAKAREYLQPLIAGEDYPTYRDGLPQYVTLKNKLVAKKLAPFE